MYDIYDLQMNKIRYPEGFTPLDIHIGSLEGSRISGKSDGSVRYIDYGYDVDKRSINITGLIHTKNPKDYGVLRDLIYDMFSVDKEFYIVEKRNPGKRILVSVTSKYIPDRITYRDSKITIELESTRLPYFESIGTSQDINRNGINLGKDLWFRGMGLDGIDNLYYRYTGLNFPIFNAGNIENHPFECDLKIVITDVIGGSKGLEIINTTNGSGMKIQTDISTSDVIKIENSNFYINEMLSIRKTNKGFIRLSPGWNNIRIVGPSSSVVEFIFRFYYR